MLQRLTLRLAPVPILLFATRQAQAKFFMNQTDALAKAFPGASRVERQTAFLTADQVKAIEAASRTKVDSSIVTYYTGFQGESKLGAALFDTRVVRTMPMTYMTVIRPDGTIAFVEVLAFHEPEDYLPRFSWLNLFRNKRLSANLRLRQDIPNVTGASLTSLAISDGIRQMLATYEEIVR